MAYPLIKFNTASGSDSQASGAGPTTAVFGTGGSINGTATVDLSADSPDLSGVATDGSAVIWLQATAGITYAKITAVDNGLKTVTVSIAMTGTESGRTWAIGGKRATLNHADSRTLFTRAQDVGQWTVEFEDDQDITTPIAFTVTASNTSGPFFIRGLAGALRTINTSQSSGTIASALQRVWLQNLKFTASHVNKVGTRQIGFAEGNSTVYNCYFGDVANTIRCALGRTSGTPGLRVINCHFQSGASGASTGMVEMGTCNIVIIGCSFVGGASTAVDGNSTSNTYVIRDCIFANNTAIAIHIRGGASTTGTVREISGNVFYNNVTGLDTTTNVDCSAGLLLFNNIFANNSSYGWDNHASANPGVHWNDHNLFYNNTSGNQNNVTAGPNDLIGVDPQFVNAGSLDFRTGANAKAQGFPDSSVTIGLGQTSTPGYNDIGIQQEAPAGGGGGGMRLVGSGGLITLVS